MVGVEIWNPGLLNILECERYQFRKYMLVFFFFFFFFTEFSHTLDIYLDKINFYVKERAQGHIEKICNIVSPS